MTEITKNDQEIIQHLQHNARISLTEISRKTGLARSTVQARIERMEALGIIQGYGVRLGEGHGARQIHATILARLASNVTPEVLAQLRKVPEVMAASTTSGRFDLVIELRVAQLSRLDEIIDLLEAIEGFEESESLVHLSRRIDRLV